MYVCLKILIISFPLFINKKYLISVISRIYLSIYLCKCV